MNFGTWLGNTKWYQNGTILVPHLVTLIFEPSDQNISATFSCLPTPYCLESILTFATILYYCLHFTRLSFKRDSKTDLSA